MEKLGSILNSKGRYKFSQIDNELIVADSLYKAFFRAAPHPLQVALDGLLSVSG